MVEDESLREAMARSKRLLPGRSSAALLRELAIRGAAALEDEAAESPGLKRILAMPGVRPPKGDIHAFLRENPPAKLPEGSDPRAVSKALEKQREERF